MNGNAEIDAEYPGTAVLRLRNVRERVASLSNEDLSGEWKDVRRKILWAGGLKDMPTAIPGQVSFSLFILLVFTMVLIGS